MFLGVAAGPERADKSDRGEAQADPLTPERHRADRPREKNEVGSDDPEQGVLQGMNFQALRLGAEVLQRLLQLGKIGRRKRVHAGESMGADHRPGSVKWAERELRAGGVSPRPRSADTEEAGDGSSCRAGEVRSGKFSYPPNLPASTIRSVEVGKF